MHEVPVSWIRHAATELGGDSAAVEEGLRAAGLPRRVLVDSGERVAARRYAAFVETAARVARDDFLGLRLGGSYDLRAAGLAGYASLAAPTLGAAMRNAQRYGALNDTSAKYRLEIGDGVATFLIETDSAYLRASRHATEFKVAFIVAACRKWVGSGFRPLEIHLAHVRGSGERELSREFGCTVRFGAASTAMLLTPEQLDLPVRSADPYLLQLVMQHADEVLAEHGGGGAGRSRSRVERLVLDGLAGGAPTIGQVATRLGLGERTLARRLAAEGVTYRQVLDELRFDMARSYLADNDLSLAQIAYLLGYGDQSAFTNAFRRWSGQPPKRFRAGY